MDEVQVTRGARLHPAPRVSVIIPAYKPTWLDDALESVRAQSFDAWEIIVVDDGSPTPVAPARSDDLVLVRHANAGPGGARNRGATFARGEYVAYLDSDNRWRDSKLAKQVRYHDEHPDCVLSATHVCVTSDGKTYRDIPPLTGRQGDVIPFSRLFYENCVGCSTAMMRRSALERTPGMVAHRRMGEDFGLWLRIGVLGSIGYIDEPLVERRHHDESLMYETSRDGSWLAAERAVYGEFLDEHPELRKEPYVRAAMARLEFQGGWAMLARGEWGAARSAIVRSLRYDPLKPKAWINLVRAILHVGPRRRA